MRVYLDHGATTPVDPLVVKAMNPFFNKNYGNASSIHQFGREARKAVEDSRALIAKRINCEPSELIFTSGGTESDNLAIKGVAMALKDKGKHIITSKIEHHAVLKTCEYLEKKGFRITYLPVDSEGFVKASELEEAITDQTILVSIMHANNEIGTIEPIEGLSKVCSERGVLFHTDAVQSFTKVKLDVNKNPIDLVSLSAHKIHGPKGVGALFVRKGVKLKPLLHGGGHEFKLRAGTENVPGIAGFSKAVQLCNEQHVKHMTKLRDKIINQSLKITDSKLNGPLKNRLCNNANLSFKGVEGESLLLMLDQAGIAVSTGSACSSGSLEPSHVLMAIGLSHLMAHGSLRLTVGRENTNDEINYSIKQLKEAVKKLRRISVIA